MQVPLLHIIVCDVITGRCQ